MKHLVQEIISAISGFVGYPSGRGDLEVRKDKKYRIIMKLHVSYIEISLLKNSHLEWT